MSNHIFVKGTGTKKNTFLASWIKITTVKEMKEKIDSLLSEKELYAPTGFEIYPGIENINKKQLTLKQILRLIVIQTKDKL